MVIAPHPKEITMPKANLTGLAALALALVLQRSIYGQLPSTQPNDRANPSTPLEFALHSSADLSAEQVNALEDMVKANPDDIESRAKLLGYYFLKQDVNPAGVSSRRDHILWMIRNHPDDYISGSPFCGIDLEIDREGFAAAKQIWTQLAEKPSQSAAVVENAIRFLIVADPKSAEELVKHAAAADPNNPQWHQDRGEIYTRALPTTQPAGQPAQRALVELEKAYVLTKDAEKRFYRLTDLPAAAMVCGDKVKTTLYAKQLLALAPDFKHDWNYGNAIHKGKLALGRVALASGDIETAKARLLDAGKTPGSPQLDSFGPNMALAQKLLKKGEKGVVLQYLDLCGKFWEGHQNTLDDWKKTIKDGGVPDFGANLVY
jgi:hypothetical protein